MFPDIPGFAKKGITTSASTLNNSEKNSVNQVITQNYQARAAGWFRLLPFTITVNGSVVRSEGAALFVQPAVKASAPGHRLTNNMSDLGKELNSVSVAPDEDETALSLTGVTVVEGAFLLLRASKTAIYAGEGVGLTLSVFVADNYPYELKFTALDRQLRTIIKKIRPANAWEENRPISKLKPVPVLIGGRKFREIRLFQSVFYPLMTRPLILPAVTLRLSRPRPIIGPPSSEIETVAFSSKPVTITVRALPSHPLREKMAVGSFRLNERLDRQDVGVGQSVRYEFMIIGEGNVATLPAPAEPAKTTGMDVFPPQERHTINHVGNQVSGRKTFTYFIVPRQNGMISLADQFQWVYFDPKRARYDTLRSRLQIRVGGAEAVAQAKPSAPAGTSGVSADSASVALSGRSLYAGIDALDSTRQPISIPVLIRAVANVLIVLMLLGMIFVFYKK